jgi:hypothetical protein
VSANISQFRKQSVVVTPDDLLKLDSSFRTFGEEPSYEVECADGLTRRFSTVQELINFENPPLKDIRLLRIKSLNATISFENTWARVHAQYTAYNNIWIYIEGEEKKVLDLLRDFEDRLAAMKPLYSFLNFLSPSILITLIWLPMVLLYIVPLIQWFQTKEFNLVTSGEYGAGRYLFLILPVLFLVLVLFFYNRGRLFPMAAFRIGQGEKRYNDKSFLRTVVLLGFGLNLLAGLVTLILQSLWASPSP